MNGAGALLPSTDANVVSGALSRPLHAWCTAMSPVSGVVLLSHGLDSGPDAAKTGALAVVAEDLGWTARRLDYRDLDMHGMADAAEPRIQRLVDAIPGDGTPCVLAGSSFGAFTSGRASIQRAVHGLFLMATPPRIPGFPQPFAMREGARTCFVHGWHDALCPVDAAIAFARGHRSDMLLLDDDHRLANHVAAIAHHFGWFLSHIVA